MPAAGNENKPLMGARSVLGNRLTEVNGCFRIDGTPKNFFDVMNEANRVRAKCGKPQIGPDSWRV